MATGRPKLKQRKTGSPGGGRKNPAAVANAADDVRSGEEPAFIRRLRRLYESATADGYRFRYGLLVFDLVTVAFIVATSFVPRADWIEAIDVVLGLGVLADFTARIVISRQRLRELLRFSTWADIAAIISLLAPLVGEGAAFLRILRTVRLLRTYQLLARLRTDSRYFRRHEEVILAVINVAVFIFITTGIVYETQHYTNPQIRNYADALYFTVTALTTTGFGDVTLTSTSGRLISVVIMVVGVTLFFNLARALISPNKVRFACPDCGLQRHEPDAVHCKACGKLLKIPDDGYA